MTDTPRHPSRLPQLTMWLVLLLIGGSLFVSLFPYGDSLAHRLALPFQLTMIGSSIYLLVGRWRGFIDREQLSLFGRGWIVFAAGLAIYSSVAFTSGAEWPRLSELWLTIAATILPAYLIARYRFAETRTR